MSIVENTLLENIGNGVLVGQSALQDSTLLNLARNYKKNIASRYRLLNEADITHIKSNSLYASLKLDGQLHFLYKNGDECFLYNIKGRVIKNLPLLEEVQKQLANTPSILLAGELYCTGTENRARVYDVTSALGSKGSSLTKSLSFGAFDLLELNDENCRALTFEEKQKHLNTLLPAKGLCHTIEQHAVDAKDLALLFKHQVTEGGEEGIVCVDETNHTIYKIKPKHNVDAVILGFTESPDITDNIRVLLTGLMRPDGSFQVFAKAGTGFDDEQRREFYHRLKAMEVPSAFTTTDRNHTVFTMVKPEIVIELAFHDLIYENTAGKPEIKPVLAYSETEGYTPLLPQAFVSVLGPVFKRIRDDKSVTPEDLRLTQLQDFVDLDNLNQGSQNLELAKSSIVRRDVYTKTTKGLVSVRKFLMWKTNKEELDNHYPPYVFCFVDYSPERKDPLKRVLRTAPTVEVANTIFDNFINNEIKRGWKPAER